MFKRGPNEPAIAETGGERPMTQTPPASSPPPAPHQAPQGKPSYGRAVIGRSIVVTGEISGQEDLLIEGRVEGRVNLPKQHVIIGPSCDVQAEIQAEVVTIEGNIIGNIVASDKVVLTREGSLTGDIKAARLSVEEGAYLKGTVELAPRQQAKPAAPPQSQARPQTQSKPGAPLAPPKPGAPSAPPKPGAPLIKDRAKD